MTYPIELTQTYDIYEQIGAGGGGTVYRAVHKRLQKTVVIKKLKGTATSIQDCRTEVDILKNLRHSYLPQVIDFIDSSEGIFTVMDFIPGKSLQNMLDEKHRFTEKEVLKYTKQLCEALDYLHSQKPPIVHGDIKPDNIMITPEGNVCLIDFNISGVLEGKGATTFGYTPGYSAPEQAEAFNKLKKQMQKETVQSKKAETKRLKMLAKQEVIAADSDKTILLQEDPDKTILMSNDPDRTILLGEEDDRTVLMEQEEAWQEAAVAREESREKTDSLPKAKKAMGISIDKRSDIYSLGATVYSLLTGKIRNPKDKKLALSNVSSGFSVVLAKALAYSPEKRYQDAGKMLQAVVSVHKKDKKYKRLLRRQEMTLIVLFLLIAASVYSIVEGKKLMAEEKEGRYETLVEELQLAAEQGKATEEFEKLYVEATSLFPQYLDAYYVKAYYLYEQQGAEVTVEYIDKVMSTPVVENAEIRGNLYYLYGECYFQLEEYEKAEFYYERAIKFTPSNAEIYRDYAIVLAYLNEMEEAESLLETAVSYGLAQADILMVQGELARMSGQYEKALECFEGVLMESRDDYMKQRAYIMASKTFEAIGTEDAFLQDVEWLNKAVKELEISSRLLIFERLVQNYITLGEMTNDNSYYSWALDVMEEIVSMSWDTYLTYNNAVILCQRMGNLDDATLWAGQMKQKYPNHYVTYIRLCYLEIEKQNLKENDERSYESFAEYYQKAKECYEKQVSGNVTNAEMLQLEQAYQQIVEGGWFE